MAHHVLRRLLKKKKFRPGSALDGLSVDQTLLLLHVLSEADPLYFTKIDGIDVADWPDSLRVLTESDGAFFGRVDGIDINSWPETLRIMLDAGAIPWAKIDGIGINRFGDSIIVFQDADPLIEEFFPGRELGNPSALRLITAPLFKGMLWPYQDGIEILKYTNNLQMMGEADPIFGGILRGPELGDPSSKRLITAPFFKGFVFPYQDGIEILRYINNFFMMQEADAIFGGVFPGKELGNPSSKRLTTAPFFSNLVWPYQDGISIKRIVSDLYTFKESDAIFGGVVRGRELGDPSPLRLEVDVELVYTILPERLDPAIQVVRTTDSLEISGSQWLTLAPKCETVVPVLTTDSLMIGNLDQNTVSEVSVFATSESSSLLFGSQPESDPNTYSLQYVFATSEPSSLDFPVQPDSDEFIIIDFLDPLTVGPTTKTIFVASDLGPLVPAVTGLGSYGLEVSLSYSIL